MANSQAKQKFTETIPEEDIGFTKQRLYTHCLTYGQSLYVVKDLKETKRKKRMVFQQIGNINKDTEFINKNPIEILELKSTLTGILKVY